MPFGREPLDPEQFGPEQFGLEITAERLTSCRLSKAWTSLAQTWSIRAEFMIPVSEVFKRKYNVPCKSRQGRPVYPV